LIHFLPRALAGQQINVLAFDQQSSLSKWTVADFQKLVASQKGLRVVVIPRYAIESAQNTVTSNFTGQQGGKKSKELRSLEKRRKAMLRRDMRNAELPPSQKAIPDLTSADLLQHITILLQLEVSDTASPQDFREQDVFLRCEAPLVACRQLVNNAKTGSRLRALTIAKDVNKQGVAPLTTQLLDLQLTTTLAPVRLRLSGLGLGTYASRLTQDLSLERLKHLMIHNCQKAPQFLKQVSGLQSKVQLASFRIS
jgi:hypothetical protein